MILARIVNKGVKKYLANAKLAQITKTHLYKYKCKFDCKTIKNFSKMY